MKSAKLSQNEEITAFKIVKMPILDNFKGFFGGFV